MLLEITEFTCNLIKNSNPINYKTKLITYKESKDTLKKLNKNSTLQKVVVSLVSMQETQLNCELLCNRQHKQPRPTNLAELFCSGIPPT